MQTSVAPVRTVADQDAPNTGYCMVGKDESDTEIGVYFEFDPLEVDGTITQVEVHAQWDNAAAGAGDAGQMVLEVIPDSGSYLMYATGASGQITQALAPGEYSTTDLFTLELYPYQNSPENLMKGFSTGVTLQVTYQPEASGPVCKVKVNGTWRPVAGAKVKSGGAWHEATAQVKRDGTWHPW